MSITEESYLTDKELKRMIKKIKGLSIVEETLNYIKTTDKYAGYQNIILFNKASIVIDGNVVESFNSEIKDLEIVDFLQSLPKVLFMNINKVYIASCEEDVELLYTLSPNHTFDLNYSGLYVCEDGNVIISLPKHEEMTEETVTQRMEQGEYSDYEEILKKSIAKTLTYCLYRSLQSNPLFENEIEQSEESAYKFTNSLFE